MYINKYFYHVLKHSYHKNQEKEKASGWYKKQIEISFNHSSEGHSITGFVGYLGEGIKSNYQYNVHNVDVNWYYRSYSARLLSSCSNKFKGLSVISVSVIR